MKIYFAGSIRGGRDDQAVYFEIIKHLEKYGEVLTEHLGDSDLTDAGEKSSSGFIYKRDMAWIKKADVVVAEVSNPSLGVGYELREAEVLGKKILCLFNPGKGVVLSAMIAGNNYFTVKEYSELKEALKIINEFFS